ncbi:esterase-like activity of phytase family protein [Qipengyuania sp. 1NDH17]|uniref:Esterase-like activity of phytase family protein n=1 Tax=Qipengyuania polymorpha TaxID=2867234 RepID=A0ABS7J5H5_9SPHN|nr:esterase-like activity of phytase family protein [Qipengyuania polymorpha]MBX7458678.1 esterase-like activity of phytase family protein [Qipengyuania polymorpha]
MKRKILACLIALGLAPGTFVRSEPAPPDYTSPVTVTELEVEEASSGPLTLEGAWLLESENDHFGGYSALIAWHEDEFLAANDAGRLMHLPRPDWRDAPPALGAFLNFARVDKMNVDIESLTFDPETGEVWAGLEWAQQIIRFSPRLQKRASINPPEMKDWGGNSGPEALARLQDGSFIVIEERALADGLHEALLFDGDPTDGMEPLRFTFEGREGYRPSDATVLPDGRLLVLLRGLRLGLPPRFTTMLVMAEPEKIEENTVLPSRVLARIDPAFPSENYEGLAVTDDGGGRLSLWLISDDNFASYQRTILLKLGWDVSGRRQARQKARR